MAEKLETLRIKAERIGTVSEIRSLLADLENAYNSIYLFNMIVDSIEVESTPKRIINRAKHFRKYWSELTGAKPIDYDPLYLEIFWGDPYFNKSALPNLLELQTKLDKDNIIPQHERLVISKVTFQSPGFWEFLGSLNPLEQIREYLKDRHERQKDRNYRNYQEKQLGILEIEEKKNNILNQRIELLQKAGYTETQIQQLVASTITTPLSQLGPHQDNGLLGLPEQ